MVGETAHVCGFCGAGRAEQLGPYWLCAEGHMNDAPPGMAVWSFRAGGAARTADHGAPLPDEREVRARPLAVIPPAPLHWLWPERIPLGAITMLDGDPDLGKSLVTLDLAARLSRGDAMPDGAVPEVGLPAATLLLTTEDSPARTIRPRLECADADIGRVHIIDVLDPRTGASTFDVPDDLPGLRELVRATGARLIIIDPFVAFVAGRVSVVRDQDVRRALTPLAALAEETGTAVLAVRHLNKSNPGDKAIYRGGGSIGIIGAARAGLLIAPDTAEPERRVLAVTKHNLARRAASLAYRVEQPGADRSRVRVRWEGEVAATAADLIAAESGAGAGAPDVSAQVGEWLAGALAGGPRRARALYEEAEAEGISAGQVRRAGARLGVVRTKVGIGKDGYWLWSLPPRPEPLPPVPDCDGGEDAGEDEP